MAVDLDGARRVGAARRHVVDARGLLDAANAAKTGDGSRHELTARGLVGVRPLGKHELHRQDAVRLVALRSVHEAVRAEHAEAGRDQERQRDRHFRHDDRAAEQLTSRGRASAFLERLRDFGRRGLQCGDQAEDARRQHRQCDREADQPKVRPERFEAGHESKDVGRHADPKGTQAEPRESEGRRHRHEREQRALGQQLADDAEAAGAEGEPDGDLPPPLRCAREQKVGDVRAGDQQHDERRRLPEREQRPGAFVEHAAEEREHAHAVVAVRVRIVTREPRGEHRHFRLRVLERRAGPQVADDREVSQVAARRHLRIERDGGPDFGALGEGESRRHHADDDVRLAVDDDRTPHDRAVGIEAPLPQRVAQDHDVVPPERFIVPNERAAEGRLRAQRFEEAARDLEAGNPLRLAAVDEVRIPPGVRGKKDQFRGVRAPVEEIGGRHRLLLVLQPRAGLRQQHDGVRILQWIRAQHETVDQVEDGRVRPEPQRERQRHDGRQPPALPERPYGGANVPPRVAHEAISRTPRFRGSVNARAPRGGEPHRQRQCLRRVPAGRTPPAVPRGTRRKLFVQISDDHLDAVVARERRREQPFEDGGRMGHDFESSRASRPRQSRSSDARACFSARSAPGVTV